jgi:endothelin-converting enzyme/putative endopeptidase
MKILLLAAASALALGACATTRMAGSDVAERAADPIPVVETAAPAKAPRYAPFGLELQHMDASVKPGDSFFDYALGTWLKTKEIPADKSGAGYNYELPDEIEVQLKGLVETAAADPTSTLGKKIGDAYAAYTDIAAIDAAGLAPLQPWLAKIDAVKTRTDLVRLMMEPGYASAINIGPSADQDDPTRYTVYAGQARLSLP